MPWTFPPLRPRGRARLLVAATTFVALSACSSKGESETGDSSEASDDASASSEGEASGSATSAESSGSTDATGSASTDDGTTGTSSGGGFVQADAVGESMCDIWMPMDCGEDEKCMPYSSMGETWDALKCVPLDENPKELGDECLAPEGPDGGTDDCGQGLFCYYVDAETNVGTCIAFCTGSPSTPTCGPNSICTVVNDGVLVLCRPSCDPIVQDCEPAGSACYQATGTGSFTCIADKSGDTGTYGDPCQYISSCDAGLACATAASVPGCDSGSCCTPFCDLSGPNNCPGAAQGQVCEPYYEQPDPGYENVGLCAVPQPKVEGGPTARRRAPLEIEAP